MDPLQTFYIVGALLIVAIAILPYPTLSQKNKK